MGKRPRRRKEGKENKHLSLKIKKGPYKRLGREGISGKGGFVRISTRVVSEENHGVETFSGPKKKSM